MESVIDFIFRYIAPVGILVSIAINFLVFSGVLHRFKTKFHKLEHLKLRLEIEKLQRDLGVKDVQLDDNFLQATRASTSPENKTPLSKALNKLHYRLIQALKWFVVFIGAMMAATTLASFGTLEDHNKIQIPISFLALDVLIYGIYVYIDEWLKHNIELTGTGTSKREEILP